MMRRDQHPCIGRISQPESLAESRAHDLTSLFTIHTYLVTVNSKSECSSAQHAELM